jgi:hypothetical protein
MITTREDADSLFIYKPGDVVLLAQDRWLGDTGQPERRQRHTVVSQMLENTGSERPKISYRIGRVEYGNTESLVSEHQIDHEASKPEPRAVPSLAVRPEDDPGIVPFVDHKEQLA